jgi:hypothetical protein
MDATMKKPLGTIDVIKLARSHLGKGAMVSSAHCCLCDAREALNRGDFDAARMWAVRSLAYSVGMFSAAYRAAVQS